MTILALDPGKTTGVARWDGSEFTAVEVDFDRTCSIVNDLCTYIGAGLTIISEAFLITQNTPKNTQAPWSLELIGVARFHARTYTGKDVILQTPSQAKRFSTDNRLRAMGFWTPGKGHANDAARHLLLYMATTGKLSEETMGKLIESV